ncbi:hypothetical protein ABIB62_001029 [Mucilaginibacter sp. UYP25]|uniref:WG repeat-containing protein n=1 Tax=unclassified Mucilaginibacter TaxID=2617802 RepID=UPI00339AF535
MSKFVAMKKISLFLSCFLVSMFFNTCVTAQNHQIVISAADNEALPFALVPYRVKNLWGFSDYKGDIKIAPQYDDVKQIKYYWTDGTSFKSVMVVRKGSNIFAINHHNKILIPPTTQFDEISPDTYYYGVAIVSKQGKEGVFYNKQIIPCLYTSVEREKNLSFRVLADGKSGIINSKGKIVVPIEYYGIGTKSITKDAVTWTALNSTSKNMEFTDEIAETPANEEFHSYIVNEPWPASVDMPQSLMDIKMKDLRKVYKTAVIDTYYSYIIYVTKNGKWGAFNLITDSLSVPCLYDELKAEKQTEPKIAIRAKRDNYMAILMKVTNYFPQLFSMGYIKRAPILCSYKAKR